jgi:hypothetical protein
MVIASNEGEMDRGVRTAIGFGLLLAGFSGFLAPALGNMATLLGIFALATALTGWCPLYTALHLDTRHR